MIQKNKTILEWFFLLLIATAVFTGSLVRTNYAFTGPGYNTRVESFVAFDDPTPLSGSFHTTSVIHFNHMTTIQYLASSVFDRISVTELSSFYESVDDDALNERSLLLKDDSLSTSLVVAAKSAGYPLDYTTQRLVTLTTDYMTKDTLILGDTIVSINDTPAEAFDFSTTSCGDTIDVSGVRQGDVFETRLTKQDLGDTCAFGFFLSDFTTIESKSLPFTFIETNTGGPSGGLMQSLYAYTQFVQLDITQGLKIAGTGTIDVDGNVGLIGGIEQKIYTAIHNDIDVFFVPYLSDEASDNYIQARAVLASLDSDLILVPVQTFEQALLYLSDLEEGVE